MTIFRDEALKKLSSPERLDEAMEAASPMYWVGYVALTLVVVAGILWGIFGSVPTRVAAEGILLKEGSEVYSASAAGEGEIVSLAVGLGERVSAGQVVAELDQAEAERRRETLTLRLAEARDALADRLAERERERELYRELTAKRRAAIEAKIANAQARIASLEELAANLRDLFDKGYAQSTAVLEREQALIAAQESVTDLRNKLVEIEEDVFENTETWRRRIDEERDEIRRYTDELEDLTTRLEGERTVNAPVAGIVTEIAAGLGDVVAPGTSVVRIVTEAQEMDALLFVSSREGKLVAPGFVVNIEPSTARKEEYGTIRARVRTVSPLPVSSQAIGSLLHNDTLVRTFTSGGAPVMIRAEIEAAGPDRFAWTGGGGPAFTIEAGTLASATITVRRQRPASLVLPFLKSLTGG